MSRRGRLAGWTLAAALLLAAFVTTGPRAVIDWRAMSAVALQSDDWGLAGFVPAADSWAGLDREALQPGRFPPVYWQSTLEEGAQVDRLADILAAHAGRDGVPAVFQPNYVMCSLGWNDEAGVWTRYELPSWPPQYQRPGLWQAVQRARGLGVWRPELHAFLHYDQARRQESALATELGREATRRGISLFTGSEGARELAPWRPLSVMTAELDTSLAVFSRVFGRQPGSVIAPDYTWHGRIEDLWQSRGLQVIQAKREQRNPEWVPGRAGRVQKYVTRQWERLVHPGRVYLERNCRLEPVQAPDAAAVVASCLAETRAAWRNRQPAVVETHRINFAHTDPGVVEVGMGALEAYLDGLDQLEEGPVYLCDVELASLQRQGTSWRLAGDRLLLRNGTHSARVIVVPGAALERLGAGDPRPRGWLVPAGGVASVGRRDLLPSHEVILKIDE